MKDHVVLVTGGGSGIGAGVAHAIVEAGGQVVLLGRNNDKLTTAAKGLVSSGTPPDVISCVSADVTDEEQVRAAIARTVDRFGRLNGVVHCAGGSETIGPLTHMDSAAWRRTVDLNINGTMYVLKHSAPEMIREGRGSFVAVSSIASAVTHRWFGAYGVSKAGLDHLVQLAADELGASSIRVNAIRPGLTRTELVEAVLSSPEVSADYRINTPLPRVGEVADIADLTVFLLSERASWITGEVINVDGGQHLRRGPDMSAMFEPIFGAEALRGVVSAT
jgi:NAD(P)-dependent dehydrogenase (short-subunit alcohol dehydrogenase family)